MEDSYTMLSRDQGRKKKRDEAGQGTKFPDRKAESSSNVTYASNWNVPITFRPGHIYELGFPKAILDSRRRKI
jgi:hypothetical protein